MVLYRRNRIAGGTYFFNVTLRDRRSTLLVDRIADLREAFRAVKRERPFRLYAMAVLPDHLHAIWTLPEGDDDYSGRWHAIKTRFTRLTGAARKGLTRNAKGEYAYGSNDFGSTPSETSAIFKRTWIPFTSIP